MGTILAFAPDADSVGLHDATRGFQPEAIKWARFWGGTSADVRFFPSAGALPKRREPIARALNLQLQPIEKLAFFCHGWRSGLQAGYNLDNVKGLASFIAGRCTDDAYVLLYACSTAQDDPNEKGGAGGDGGFADVLRDACEALGRHVTVLGHTTRGVSTTNPYARAFRAGTGGKGGEWYVSPDSALWPRWCRALVEPLSTLRFRFPVMSSVEIASELMTDPPLVA